MLMSPFFAFLPSSTHPSEQMCLQNIQRMMRMTATGFTQHAGHAGHATSGYFGNEEPDHVYLQMALAQAMFGVGRTHPNPPVGAVIVKNGVVLGMGYHHAAGQPHAEVAALSSMQNPQDAKGATIYVTLEPCSHYGRTPPCADRLVQEGFARVVVGTIDPNPVVAGRGIKRLQEAGIVVDIAVGMWADMCRALIAPFAQLMLQQKPWLLAKVATTLDGKIAVKNGDSKYITGTASRRLVHSLRNRLDAILVGANTVLQDNPLLNVRQMSDWEEDYRGDDPYHVRDPYKIIVDPQLKTTTDLDVYKNHPQKPRKVLVVTTDNADTDKKRRFVDAGIEVVMVDRGQNGRGADFSSLLRLLGQRGFLSVLAETGPQLFTSLLQSGLLDELWWFTAPSLAGGDAIAAVGDLHLGLMQNRWHLQRHHTCIVDDDVLWVSARPFQRTSAG